MRYSKVADAGHHHQERTMNVEALGMSSFA